MEHRFAGNSSGFQHWKGGLRWCLWSTLVPRDQSTHLRSIIFRSKTGIFFWMNSRLDPSKTANKKWLALFEALRANRQDQPAWENGWLSEQKIHQLWVWCGTQCKKPSPRCVWGERPRKNRYSKRSFFLGYWISKLKSDDVNIMTGRDFGEVSPRRWLGQWWGLGVTCCEPLKWPFGGFHMAMWLCT